MLDRTLKMFLVMKEVRSLGQLCLQTMTQTLCLGLEENRLCTSGTSLKDHLLRIANHRHFSDATTRTIHPIWEAEVAAGLYLSFRAKLVRCYTHLDFNFSHSFLLSIV